MPEPTPFRHFDAPIVEAILDVHCDLAPNLNRNAFQSAAQKNFADHYPEFRTAFIHQQTFQIQGGRHSKSDAVQTVRGFQSFSRDKKQIVQSRFDGFSFNRLAPYSSLDDYLPEIERCWGIFCSFAQPVVVKRIGLRYINRILLPPANGGVDIEKYLKSGPILPAGLPLALTGFVHQNGFLNIATEETGNIVLAAQPPEQNGLPVILDIEVNRSIHLPPGNWGQFLPFVLSLRALKNHIFNNTVTDACLKLSQQP